MSQLNPAILVLSLLIFTPLSFAQPEDPTPSCASQFLQISGDPAITDSVLTDQPLNYSLDEIESWIFKLKKRVVKSMLAPESYIGQFLKHQGNMTTSQRTELLAYDVELRPLSKGSSIYLAVFWSDNNLNRSQMRAELFEFGGGDTQPGEIPSDSSMFLHESLEACRGLNLTGKAFYKFYDEATKSNTALWPEEMAFYNRVIGPLKKIHPDGEFNIISIQAKGAAIDTIVHEGHHALMDSNPEYKKVLLEYWDQNIRDSQDTVINETFRTPYSTYSLLQDEFFAYLFQPDVFGQQNPMKSFKSQHLQPVLDALHKAGLNVPFYPKNN